MWAPSTICSGTAFAFTNNWFDVLDTAQVVPDPNNPGRIIQDGNISAIVLNAILVAAGRGRSFRGRVHGWHGGVDHE